MFHVFVISLLLLFFFCSTERFLPLLCNVTLIISLSDKAAVDNANDVCSFCLMTGSLGFPWRSSSSVLSLRDLSSPVCFFSRAAPFFNLLLPVVHSSTLFATICPEGLQARNVTVRLQRGRKRLRSPFMHACRRDIHFTCTHMCKTAGCRMHEATGRNLRT